MVFDRHEIMMVWNRIKSNKVKIINKGFFTERIQISYLKAVVTKNTTKTRILDDEGVRGWHETGGIENIHRWWFQPENKTVPKYSPYFA